MADLTCTEASEAAGEFALGILAPNQRARVAAHLLRCSDGRQEIVPMTAIGALAAGGDSRQRTPLGFNRKALARVHPCRCLSPRQWRPRPRS